MSDTKGLVAILETMADEGAMIHCLDWAVIQRTMREAATALRASPSEAVERDAARYRWLRNHIASEDIEFYINHDGGDALEAISAETDAAIDAVLSRSEEK
jgi:hypothetical protein